MARSNRKKLLHPPSVVLALLTLVAAGCGGASRAGLERAKADIEAGNFPAAISELDGILKYLHDDAEAHYLRAVARYRWAEELQHMADRERGADPRLAVEQLERASIAHDAAAVDFRRAAELDPEQFEEAKLLAKKAQQAGLHVFDRLSHSSEFDDAIERAERIANAEPDAPDAKNELGCAYLDRAEANDDQADARAAIRAFDVVVKAQPGELIGWFNRGSAYTVLGELTGDDDDLRRAIADFDRAIALAPEFAAAYCNRGDAFEKLGEWRRAVADFTRTIELDPKLSIAWYNRGDIAARWGKLDEAIEDFTTTIRLDPQFADAYAQRGLAYFNRGDFDAAAADFERAKALGVEVEQPIGEGA